MDEFFFFNPKAFASIFPVTATGAMLVMTSSLSPGAQTSAMRILDVTYDDGTPVVKKLNWVQACVECRRKGTPEKCHHIARPPQHFQSWGSQARLSKLLSVDPGAYDREVLNITDDPSIVPAFQSEWIDSMLSTAQSLQGAYSHFFIAIDPSGGRDRNFYALVSMVFTPDRCIVCLAHTGTHHTIALSPHAPTPPSSARQPEKPRPAAPMPSPRSVASCRRGVAASPARRGADRVA
jgi:hypothetical protein